MMGLSSEDRTTVERAKEAIDRVGRDLSKVDWIDLCEDVADYYRVSAEAAREPILDQCLGELGGADDDR